MTKVDLPSTDSNTFRWDRVIALGEPDAYQAIEWGNTMRNMGERVQSVDIRRSEGHRAIDFIVFCVMDSVLDAFAKPVTAQMMELFRNNPNVPQDFMPIFWHFFGTHLPRLRQAPDKAYKSAYLHSDSSDFRVPGDGMDYNKLPWGELSSEPAVLWSPPNVGDLGTRVIVPYDYVQDESVFIPALASRSLPLFSERKDPERLNIILKGIQEKRLRFLNLQPGIVWFLGAPVIHSRTELPEYPLEGEGWRYNFRLSLTFQSRAQGEEA